MHFSATIRRQSFPFLGHHHLAPLHHNRFMEPIVYRNQSRPRSPRVGRVNPPPDSRRKIFLNGEVVPASGIYQVTHSSHRLPHEVTLLSGKVFPRCIECADAVRFKLIRSAPELDKSNFRVTLHALPLAS